MQRSILKSIRVHLSPESSCVHKHASLLQLPAYLWLTVCVGAHYAASGGKPRGIRCIYKLVIAVDHRSFVSGISYGTYSYLLTGKDSGLV